MKLIDIYQVDAFTDKPFCGNPAGVVPNAEGLTETEMQNIAREMALSETAFVFEGIEGEYDFEVRFFTPTDEVDLCGHATIATFYLLGKINRILNDGDLLKIKQKTKAGILDVEIEFKDGEPVNILMNQSEPEHLWTLKMEDNIHTVASLEVEDFFLNDQLNVPKVYSTGLPDIIMPIKDLETLKRMRPHMDLLAEYSKNNEMAGLHAFTIENGEIFVRNFAPAYGIDEESATGTANGALIAYLYDHGYFKGNTKGEIIVHQGDFMGRPSKICAKITEENNVKKVQVGGIATVVLKGKLRL